VIDLHFHCLPGIDDGPADWAEALELCRLAATEGATTIVATPHVLRDPWWNEDVAARQALVDELNRRLGGAPEIVAGSEVWFTDALVELAEAGERGPFTTLAGSRHLLVEFPPGYVAAQAAAAFHELSVMGIVPVVAHPERNLVFAREPGRLAELVDAGALAQVTAGSLVGEFGRGARAAAEGMVASGLAHFVASDAHDPKRRPPRMAAARERVRKLWGAEVEAGLFDANPAALLADAEPPWSWGG
jgi:protein-tyrosine phosphatase